MEDLNNVAAPSADETKSFLYTWLSKQKFLPEYNVRPSGGKQRQRFLCELSVAGFPYRAAGNSTSKKDAQTNAAKDFIQYLIRSNNINVVDIPSSVLAFTPSAMPPQPLMAMPMEGGQGQGTSRQDRPVFRGGMGPRDMGEGYRPYGGGQQPDFDAINARKVADAEDLDVNAGLHGNWTIENAKSRLHQFFQMNNIKADYKFSSVGPPHASWRHGRLTRVRGRNFTAYPDPDYFIIKYIEPYKWSFQVELNVFIKQLGRPIIARETGSNKQTASKSCALSMVRQLYHLRVIEAFSGTLKRAKESASSKPYPVRLDPSLMAQVHGVLGQLGITPTPASVSNPEQVGQPQFDEGGGGEQEQQQGINLIQEPNKDLPFLHKNEDNANAGSGGIVSWSPPVPNWNPWTSCNIDEGHMASTPLEQLSMEFLESFREIQQTNAKVQELYTARSSLPIYGMKGKIMEAISEYPVVLIKGDTGCGKTTQICQFILDDWIQSEQGAFCNVVITQPRRISAISVAERVATERGEELGQTVGYSVRFESCLPRPYASILFCTVGVLLRKLEGGLRGVSHVIVDELHERDVNSDFLLVILRDMLSVYPDLRVILMSATIDDTLFTQYFNGCPVIHVEGRAFPVDTYFLEDIVENLQFMPSPDSVRQARAKKKDKDGDDDDALGDQGEENLNILAPNSGYSAQTIRAMGILNERDINWELLSTLLTHIRMLPAKGAILIFLPGWAVIFSVLKYLQEHPVFGSSSYYLIPLHSQLPREDQHRVFERVPENITKIILSTNIAETSVTIDDVVFVIDSCKAKTKLFTSHNNMTTYVTMWASKSNLLQRRGRAGRVRQGYCYHLCSKARFENLEENMIPEMFRTPLHEIALSIKLLRLGGIAQFLSKAPEPPPLDAVIEAQALLYDINCLDNSGELTPLGKILAKLPLDPRLGKMIILGSVFGVADPIAVIAANSSNMSEVFNLGPDNKRLAPQQRGFAANRHSDHFALLNAFQQWLHQREKKGEQAEYEFCQQRLLSLPSLRMTCDAKNQLLQVLLQCDFPEESLNPIFLNFRQEAPALDTIAGLLCAGLYPNVCYHVEKRKVLTTESKSALVHKASVNCTKWETYFPYPFFIFGEKIRTRAISCKQMTVVSPVHLLLFGSRKVEVTQGIVRLDNWINLEMNPEDASAIVALRPAIESLVLKVSENPEGFFPLSADDDKLVSLVVNLCNMRAGKYGMEDQSMGFGGNRMGGGRFAAQNQDYEVEQEGQNYAGYEGYSGEGQGEGQEHEAENPSSIGEFEQTGPRGVKRTSVFDNEEGEEGNGSMLNPLPPPKRTSFGLGEPGQSPIIETGGWTRGGHGRGGNFGASGGAAFDNRGGGSGYNSPNRGRGGGYNSPRGGGGGYRGGNGSSWGSSPSPGGFNNLRGRGGGYSGSGSNFSPLGGRGGTQNNFTPRGNSNFTPRGSGGFNSGFGQQRPRFFSTNRGGWNSRGGSGGGRGFSRGGGGGYSRPRQNYPY